MSDGPLDPSRCPLCRQQNACGMAEGSGTCWCFESPISSEMLDRVPREGIGLACLCQSCLSGLCQPATTLKKIRECIRTWR